MVELEECEATARGALDILKAGKAGAYEQALAELDKETQRSWQEEVAPELEGSDEMKIRMAIRSRTQPTPPDLRITSRALFCPAVRGGVGTSKTAP